MPIRVTVWNEFLDEKRWPEIMTLYPGGVHGYLGQLLRQDERFDVKIRCLQDACFGLDEQTLNETDVLIYYSHVHKQEPSEAVLAQIIQRVQNGMGIIFLHSGLFSKLASRLIGPRGKASYREYAEKERVWVIERGHPIAQGLDAYFEFPQSEMYGDPCDIPTPDELIFISWYSGGNAARSGYTYRRGAGKVFCFTPGHAWYAIMTCAPFHQVLRNAVSWAQPPAAAPIQASGPIKAYEDIPNNDPYHQ
jgi:trehalose utilization protein